MSKNYLKIASGQINTHVGRIDYNLELGVAQWDAAEAQGADLLVLPEQWVAGYPIEDMVERDEPLEECEQALFALLEMSEHYECALTVGIPEKHEDGKVYNAAYVIHKGKILGAVQKRDLPNYDVFDDKRNYAAAKGSKPIELKGVKLGVFVCEDGWTDQITNDLAEQGAEVLVSLNASPYMLGKHKQVRLPQVITQRAGETGLPYLYVNQVGGQDEIVFDGCSVAVNADGEVMFQAPAFEENLGMVTLNVGERAFEPSTIVDIADNLELNYQAAVIALRDYITKNGFQTVQIGMSGGADSALVASIAVDAIGAENVYLLSMPTKYNSNTTKSYARQIAETLGANFEEKPIQVPFEVMHDMLAPIFNNQSGVWEENIQARFRGMILMAYTNYFPGRIMLSTGNKSEMAVGFATLYGDMCGGYNPIKDFYKTEVFDLILWRNRNHRDWMKGPAGQLMPDELAGKLPPSAELREDQVDTNSLPPYSVLDPILMSIIEDKNSFERTVAVAQKKIEVLEDYDVDPREVTNRVYDLLHRAEYKRRQAPPGPKIQRSNFGKGWRWPITGTNLNHMSGMVERYRTGRVKTLG